MNGIGSATVSAIAQTLGAALTATLLVAVFTVAVAEFARPQLRRWRQRHTLAKWLSAQWPPGAIRYPLPDWLAKADPRVEETLKSAKVTPKGDVWKQVRRGSGLTNELFMRSVQNEADAILEQPAAFPEAFALLSSWASADERATVVALDRLGRADPELLAKLFPAEKRDHSRNDEEAARLSSAAAAQEAVGRSVERQLDALQLDLTSDWSSTMQWTTMAVGVVVACVGTSGQWRDLLVGTVIGVLGGFVAGWLQTLLVFLTTRRSG